MRGGSVSARSCAGSTRRAQGAPCSSVTWGARSRTLRPVLRRRGLLWLACLGALSCLEPTQVTLELSTNAACASRPLAPLMLVETAVLAGPVERLYDPDVAANTTTADCNAGDIGTVVLYPTAYVVTAEGKLFRVTAP